MKYLLTNHLGSVVGVIVSLTLIGAILSRPMSAVGLLLFFKGIF